MHAEPGDFGRRDHGRAHSQSDARARAPTPFVDRGRSGARGEATANDGNIGEGSGGSTRGDWANRGAQSEVDGAHGNISGGCGAPPISGFSDSERSPFL